MVWTEALALSESRQQQLLPMTCGYRASRRLYPAFYCGGLMARPDRFLLGRHARRSVNYACLIENAPPGCLVCSAIE